MPKQQSVQTDRPTDRPTDIAGFRVACMRLYNPLCRSVSLSVGRSVSLSVGRSVTLLFRRFSAFFALLLLPKCSVTFFITAPAHLHATLVAVYLALFTNIWYYLSKKQLWFLEFSALRVGTRQFLDKNIYKSNLNEIYLFIYFKNYQTILINIELNIIYHIIEPYKKHIIYINVYT